MSWLTTALALRGTAVGTRSVRASWSDAYCPDFHRLRVRMGRERKTYIHRDTLRDTVLRNDRDALIPSRRGSQTNQGPTQSRILDLAGKQGGNETAVNIEAFVSRQSVSETLDNLWQSSQRIFLSSQYR